MKIDRDGNAYLGITVGYRRLRPYLEELWNLLGAKAYRSARRNKIRRDGLRFHLTVVSPPEMARLKCHPQFIERPRVRLIGLGRAAGGSSTAYYVVAKCSAAEEFRTSMKLPPKDFHVTLGFRGSDIHTVAKSERTLVKPTRQVKDRDSQ